MNIHFGLNKSDVLDSSLSKKFKKNNIRSHTLEWCFHMNSRVSTALIFRVGSVYHVQRDTINITYIKLVIILIYKVIIHWEAPVVGVLLFCLPSNNKHLFNMELKMKEQTCTLNVTWLIIMFLYSSM
jgi:hypothetical protein